MNEVVISQRKGSHLMRMALIGLSVLALVGCQTTGGGAPTSNQAHAARQSESDRIFDESFARYKAMAEAGNPKGVYYLAVVHAAQHMNEDGMDALNVQSKYEDAVRKGSNDARVALGNMLICGSTGTQWTVACFPNVGLPKPQRDPARGVELLKQAATTSCSFSEPLIAYGRCREREKSIPLMLELVYRDGKGGIPKDPMQEAYWRAREEACKPEIDRVNRQRGC